MAVPDSGQWRLLNLLAQDDLAALEAALAAADVHVLRLDGAAIHDRGTFFAQAAHDLPYPAGRAVEADWDALADSLWEGFLALPGTQFALVWTDVQALLDGGLGTLLEATNGFLRFSRQLLHPSDPKLPRKMLYLFLLGTGPNFPS